jgi:hypothetical protein
MSQMEPTDPFKSPEHGNQPPVQPGEGDSTGGIIPYKNTPALIAYYLGIFSLIPCAGLVLAIPAVILGIMGLRKRAQNPAVKGTAHAWIGIILGSICTLLWGGLLLMSIFGAAMAPMRM